MVIRYMGTKRHMAEHVRDTIADLNPSGRVVDLFSGMGSVAESLRDTCSVVTNDALTFTASISRARFTGKRRDSKPADVLKRLEATFDGRRSDLKGEFAHELSDEIDALANDEISVLAAHMDRVLHAGNSPQHRRRARAAAVASDSSHYSLASIYFAGGYLSLAQAIEVDALRAAIDADSAGDDRDWILAAWLAATSVLVNAPGHTAQFLRPNSLTSHARIVRTWQRSIWDEFEVALNRVSQVGTTRWRSANEVFTGDALELIASGHLDNIGAFYADPPYTKDQYSRYYHMYETLYRYDFPDSHGAGRNRSDRFTTGFSLKTAVTASFHDLCRNVCRMKLPLIVSYPTRGLLSDAGSEVDAIAKLYFSNVSVKSFDASHSTMGASDGASKKAATENLYVCTV